MSARVEFTWDDDADQSLALPAYETPGAAGADVRLNLRDRGSVTLAPGARAVLSTGLRVAIPAGFEMQVRPRSGLALKHGITVANAPGTIDSDYRGPLGVILINLGDTDFTLTHGDRIAQLIVAPIVQADFAIVDTLSKTSRGSDGFGSTGVS